MDATDLTICKALIRDARMPYRNLAKLTGLSPVAVHKRVLELINQGIINKFQAEIDIRALKGMSIMVFGRSESSSPSQLSQALAENDRTSMVLFGSGNYVYVGAMLRSVSEMEHYIEFVRDAGKMPQAVAGIHTIRPSGKRMADIPDPGEISPLEIRIISALRDDARRRTTDVAKELGVTARTVASKLQRMIDENKVLLTIQWRPDYSNDIVALFHMKLKEGTSKPDVIKLLHERYASNVVFLSSFGNIPEMILATVWTRSSKEVSGIVDSLMNHGHFESITPNVICEGNFFDTWKEKLLADLAKKASKQQNRIGLTSGPSAQ
jgi:DNA-binding Lrp family transcriptional regulator